MSGCYLDTNFLYGHLRAPRERPPAAFEHWRSRVLELLDGEEATISPLVLDELAYRLILAWLRDDGTRDPLSAYRSDPTAAMKRVRARLTRTWRAIDALALSLAPTDRRVVERAQSLMGRPGLPPRDAFHAAHALATGCTLIASADPAFEHVRGLRRIAP